MEYEPTFEHIEQIGGFFGCEKHHIPDTLTIENIDISIIFKYLYF